MGIGIQQVLHKVSRFIEEYYAQAFIDIRLILEKDYRVLDNAIILYEKDIKNCTPYPTTDEKYQRQLALQDFGRLFTELMKGVKLPYGPGLTLEKELKGFWCYVSENYE